MKKNIYLLAIAIALFSCKKNDDKKSVQSLAITDLGFQYNANYRIQEYIQISSNPVKWDYVDMSGPILVKFIDGNNITETRGNNSPQPAKFEIKGVSNLNVSNGKAYAIAFMQVGICSNASICPLVVSANSSCKLYNEGSQLFLHKDVGSSYYDGFRFIKQ